jgi:hypothetical protein
MFGTTMPLIDMYTMEARGASPLIREKICREIPDLVVWFYLMDLTHREMLQTSPSFPSKVRFLLTTFQQEQESLRVRELEDEFRKMMKTYGYHDMFMKWGRRLNEVHREMLHRQIPFCEFTMFRMQQSFLNDERRKIKELFI